MVSPMLWLADDLEQNLNYVTNILRHCTLRHADQIDDLEVSQPE